MVPFTVAILDSKLDPLYTKSLCPLGPQQPLRDQWTNHLPKPLWCTCRHLLTLPPFSSSLSGHLPCHLLWHREFFSPPWIRVRWCYARYWWDDMRNILLCFPRYDRWSPANYAVKTCTCSYINLATWQVPVVVLTNSYRVFCCNFPITCLFWRLYSVWYGIRTSLVP